MFVSCQLSVENDSQGAACADDGPAREMVEEFYRYTHPMVVQ
jgi:hypothetical protein